MPWPGRDPLSVAYDRTARRVLLAAIARHRAGGGTVQIWVASPGHEVRRLDAGGLTRHERAFRRALYYPVVQTPRRNQTGQVWSLRVWPPGPFERRGGRYGRYHRVRLYRYGARGYVAAERRRGPGYTVDAARRSYVGEGGVRVIPRAG